MLFEKFKIQIPATVATTATLGRNDKKTVATVATVAMVSDFKKHVVTDAPPPPGTIRPGMCLHPEMSCNWQPGELCSCYR